MGNRLSSPGQIISLPQGGGALQGLGETFAPDLFTGTGNFTVPITLPAGRNGLQPQLQLVYSTGNGSSPFGLGWQLSVPGVRRKTAKGVPVYDDSQDTFLLSSSEDLIPVTETGSSEYRPRTDSIFAHISHHKAERDDYWEVRSKDGLISLYGTPGRRDDDPAALVDPANSRHIFAWNLAATRDPFGNQVSYEYIDDQSKKGERAWSQLYPSIIRYVDYGDPAEPEYLVTVRFQYQERPDPFSSRSAGFEIRTTLRCSAIEIFVQAENGSELIRTYRLHYRQAVPNGLSLLEKIEVEGHRGTRSERLAPLQFTYTEFLPDQQRFFPITSSDSPSGSLAWPDYELADLDGNGLPDFLELNGSAQYWRNLGNGQLAVRRVMTQAPAGISLQDTGAQLLDANGDGRVDLMVINERIAGYYPMAANGEWDQRSFQPYDVAPSFSLKDPEVRLLDLTGDGVTDALRTGTRLECFFNDPQQGWHRTRSLTRRALDVFPNVSFADPRIQLACMTGDSLQDIVFVSNGHVEYWPSLGYGNWGARIIMENSPRFPDGYDPRRVLLGDVDGDGLADLIYVDDQRVTLWINQSGNGWSEGIEISGTPPVADTNAIRLTDMLGNGIGGILWSAPAQGTRPNLHFLDFTGGVKPYLLSTIVNNTGAETHIEYAPSTRYYLEDEKKRVMRWQTSLPFPVQVVARVTSIDCFTGNALTTEYSYHHGYWDGVEREFRGFGRVDHLDTLHTKDLEPSPHYAPPTETRTWFHLGPISDQFAGHPYTANFSNEYWPDDPQVLPVPPLPDVPTSREKRDALRALRGNILRTELYALDNSALVERPYQVSEHSYGVRLEFRSDQSASSARPDVFFPHLCAQRTTAWERGIDPRTTASFQDDYDDYGQPHLATSIAVPRGRDYRDPAPPTEPYLATLAVTAYALPPDQQHFMADRVSNQAHYEIRNDGSLSLLELHQAIIGGQATRALISQTMHFYDGEAFSGLPSGKLGDYGVPVRTEELVLTDALLRELYHDEHGPEIPPYLVHDGPPPWTSDYPEEFRTALPGLAGYHFYSDETDAAIPPGYYIATQRLRYDFQTPGSGQRGLVLAQMDPIGNLTQIDYDFYDLLPERVTDAAGLIATARYDYPAMQPREFTDSNGNRTVFTYMPLGFVASRAVMGKEGQPVGDTLAAPSTRWSYDYLAFLERRQPISVRTTRREYHITDTSIPLPLRDQTIDTVEYSDGFGRLLQTRTQGEEVLFGDPIFGNQVLPADQSQPGGTTIGHVPAPGSPPRTVVSGWQIYDNKGRVVEKYEPFFAQGWEYAQPSPDEDGQRILMSYDPLGRLIETVQPDGSQALTVYGVPTDITNPAIYAPTPWETYDYDANDNAGRTDPIGSASYEQHWNTPISHVQDALGRVVKTVVRNGHDPEDWYDTSSVYDIRGNLLTSIDELGRVAFQRRYDLLNRQWRIEQLDSGVKRVVLDATGQQVEHRDSRGALKLSIFDELLRPRQLWARDEESAPVTVREHLIYGDSPDSGLTPQEAAQRNLLGALYKHYDEAGLVLCDLYDFKRNVAEKGRQTLSDLATQVGYPRVQWRPSIGDTVLDPTVYRFSYTYDALNRIETLHYPLDVTGQRKVLFPHYNRAGELKNVTLDGEIYVENIAYNARGQRTLIAYGNGIMTRYAYDAQTFHLVRLRSEPYTMPEQLTYQPTGAAPLQDYGYDYDLVGNPLALHDRTPGDGVPIQPDRLDRIFTYDPLYRLLSASGRECVVTPPDPWSGAPRCQDITRTRLYSEAYRYDPADNLLQVQHRADNGNFTRTMELATGTNRLARLQVSGSDFAYRYDENGNIIGETTSRHFTWDHSDRMVGFTIQPDGSQEASLAAIYSYDGNSGRVKKLVRKQGNSLAVTIYIDGIFEVQRLTQGQDVIENNLLHIMDNEQHIALIRVGPPLPGDPAPAVQYQLADQLGSSNVVINQDGAWIRREEYTPFGETSFGSFAYKRYRYSGKERDEESGLYYFGARYLTPYLGRWTSCDPAGTVDGLNLYAYVSNNPLRLTDATGTEGGDNQNTGATQTRATGVAEGTSTGQQHTDNIAANVVGPGANATFSTSAESTYNTNQRMKYIKTDQKIASDAQQQFEQAKKTNNPEQGKKIAFEAANKRNEARAATQKSLTPGGYFWSKIAENVLTPEQLFKKNSISKEGKAVPEMDAYQGMIKSAGKPNQGLSFLEKLSKAMPYIAVFGAITTLAQASYRYNQAPASGKNRVVAEEVGGFTGGFLSTFGLPVGALLGKTFGKTVMGNPRATGTMLAFGMASSFLFGFAGSTMGRQIGGSVYQKKNSVRH